MYELLLEKEHARQYVISHPNLKIEVNETVTSLTTLRLFGRIAILLWSQTFGRQHYRERTL